MNPDLHGPNTISVDGSEYLLVNVDRSHLVPRAKVDEAGQPALPDWLADPREPWAGGYDLDLLGQATWSQRTLCGREWQEMAPGDGPGFHLWSQPVYAPSCRSCLRSVGRSLVTPTADPRIPLLVSLVIEEVQESGSSQVEAVPGDQVEALRTALRAGLRIHHLRCRTYVGGTTVVVVSDDAWDALSTDKKRALDEAAAEAMGAAMFGEPRPKRVAINWRTWSVN